MSSVLLITEENVETARKGSIRAPTSMSTSAKLNIVQLHGTFLIFLNGSQKIEASTKPFPMTVTGESIKNTIPIVQEI